MKKIMWQTSLWCYFMKFQAICCLKTMSGKSKPFLLWLRSCIYILINKTFSYSKECLKCGIKLSTSPNMCNVYAHYLLILQTTKLRQNSVIWCTYQQNLTLHMKKYNSLSVKHVHSHCHNECSKYLPAALTHADIQRCHCWTAVPLQWWCGLTPPTQSTVSASALSGLRYTSFCWSDALILAECPYNNPLCPSPTSWMATFLVVWSLQFHGSRAQLWSSVCQCAIQLKDVVSEWHFI